MNIKNIEDYRKYTTEDLVQDDYFLHWVLHPDDQSNSFWGDFLSKYPDKEQQIKEAILIIKSFRAVEPVIDKKRLNRIINTIKPDSIFLRKKVYGIIKIAASLLLIISLGMLAYYIIGEKQELPFEVASGDSIEQGKVIFSDGTEHLFDTDQTKISQTAPGELTINMDTVLKDPVVSKTTKPAMNRVVIPYGKRVDMTLADGTHIWLNSGSQLSYPVKFSDDSRAVYLSGEAFFDVNSDPSTPFSVITQDMKIEVTGTRFNVSSYANDKTTQAVLVSGKIEAAKNKRFAGTVELSPGERVVYNKGEDDISKSKVNVELYSSWIDGYLIFEQEPLNEIFSKLERYYNKKILTEKLSGQKIFSGKLDLADDLEQVLKNIAFSASFSVECKDDVFIVKP